MLFPKFRSIICTPISHQEADILQVSPQLSKHIYKDNAGNTILTIGQCRLIMGCLYLVNNFDIIAINDILQGYVRVERVYRETNIIESQSD